MRLAFVSIMRRSEWAACEELWADAARQALTSGHEVFVSVYERSENAPQIAELRAAGAIINVRSDNHWGNKSAIISRVQNTFGALKQFDAEAICVSQGGTYDITRSGAMHVLRTILKRNGTPYVLLCHCQQAAPRSARRKRARKVFGDAAVLGMLSKNLRSLSEQHLGTRLDNVRIFQNPLKLKSLNCLPWPRESTLRMAFVGRLEHVKGLDLLVDALAAPIWRERDWRLTICGSGPDRRLLEERVNAAGLSNRIAFAGFVTDISDVWATHHVLVMSSRLEGIPIALTEAMLCGRPVVATNVGGIGEALQDGRSGFLIEHAAVADVTAALERMWSNRSQLESMGRFAFESTLAARDPNPGATLVNWMAKSAQTQRCTRGGGQQLTEFPRG